MTLHPAAGPLKGRVTVPGDKSIGHRSLILGALADGPSTVTGLSAGADVASTRRCLEALGVRFEDLGPGAVRVHGVGLEGFTEPTGSLDAGNSGTTVRLLAGVVAGRGFPVTFTGDASLSRRPMGRVAAPLKRMGAIVEGTELAGKLLLPMTIAGAGLQAIHYESPLASAQVKSCVLLAGLRAIGRTAVSEPALSRDHTERMLAAMGAPLTVDGPTVRLEGPVARLAPVDRVVPGDPSSAAFLIAAACLVPGSEVRVENVCVNPTRVAFVDALRKMGADVTAEDTREVGGEPVGTLVARYAGRLTGVDLEGADVAGLIDEVPILAAVAALAEGATRFAGVGELRVKESDRIATTCEMLSRFGVATEENATGFAVHGREGPLKAPGTVRTHGDHRIALTAAVLALVADGPTELDDASCMDVSFPGFGEVLRGLGAPGPL